MTLMVPQKRKQDHVTGKSDPYSFHPPHPRNSIMPSLLHASPASKKRVCLQERFYSQQPRSYIFPPEILEQILGELLNDRKSTSIYSALRNVSSCLLVSKSFYLASLPVLYTHIPVSHSAQFSALLHHLKEYPYMGKLVRCLDFSGFNPVGLGRTERENAQVMDLTATTLSECLDLTPNLQEFLVNVHMENDIDELVLRNLFSLKRLEAVDFCACSSESFIQAFQHISTTSFFSPSLRRVSFHECSRLPPSVYEHMIPYLPNLTHLDVTHTQILAQTLRAISPSARLTHLSIAKCPNIPGDTIASFLMTHPAVQELFYLNLHHDPTLQHPLSEELLNLLLPSLPSTIQQLILDGAVLSAEQLKLLPHTLTELSIAFSGAETDDVVQLLETDGCRLEYLNMTGLQLDAFTMHRNGIFLHGPVRVYEVSEKLRTSLLEDRSDVPWEVVLGRGTRGWYVHSDEVRASGGIPKWCSHKVDCCESLERVRGMYSYYSFSRL